jgi:hypothetical protein
MMLHAGFRPAVFDSNGGCLQPAEDTPFGAWPSPGGGMLGISLTESSLAVNGNAMYSS